MKANSLSVRDLADQARPLYLEAASFEMAPFALGTLARGDPAALPALLRAAAYYAAAGLPSRALSLLDEAERHPRLTPPRRAEIDELRAGLLDPSGPALPPPA